MSLFGKKKEETKVCCCGEKCDSETRNEAEKKKMDAGIKVLGGGCAKCHELEANTKAALQELGLNENVEMITDFSMIASYGVMTTPALVVDGRIVGYGKVMKTTEIIDKIKEVRN